MTTVRSAVGNGCIHFAEHANGRNLNFQPDFNSSGQTCGRYIMIRAVFKDLEMNLNGT